MGQSEGHVIDDFRRPWLPWPIRLANALGRPLATRFISLQAESLESMSRNATGLSDFGDHDAVGKDAQLQHPQGLAVHNDLIYVADSYNNKIKSVAIGSLQVKTIAGSGKQGDVDGHSSIAQFSEPAGLAVVGDRMFIADTNNHKIKVFEFDTGEVYSLDLSGL